MAKKTVPTFRFETPHWQTGRLVAGVDEVGRGPLAGPVYAAAVVFPANTASEVLLGVNDSKRLSHSQRQKADETITSNAMGSALGWANVEEIDLFNIRQATKLAMLRALISLFKCARFEHVFTDAMELTEEDVVAFGLKNMTASLPPFVTNLTSIVGGDGKSLSIAAASIVAKLARDGYMLDLHNKYPQYDFSKNKGYGTKAHIEALKVHGPTIHHRKSFEPVKSMVS